jgi:hypothetical protein
MSSNPPDISDMISQLLQNQQNFQANLTSVSEELTQLRNRMGSAGFTNALTDTTRTHQFGQTSIKLDIPKFDGTNPLGWIFTILMKNNV